MATLSTFLHPVSANQEKEVIISTRFQDEQGNPVPFVIRALSQEENEKLLARCTKKGKNGQPDTVDNIAYSRQLICAAVKVPDFSDAELCRSYGVVDPSLVPGKMLLVGEHARLVREIQDFCGFSEPEDIGAQAKN